MQKKEEVINHPSHYVDGGIETIDILRAKLTWEEYLGFLKGNVIKYMTRAGKKEDGLKDIKKAQWYLDRLIKEIEDKEKILKTIRNG